MFKPFCLHLSGILWSKIDQKKNAFILDFPGSCPVIRGAVTSNRNANNASISSCVAVTLLGDEKRLKHFKRDKKNKPNDVIDSYTRVLF